MKSINRRKFLKIAGAGAGAAALAACAAPTPTAAPAQKPAEPAKPAAPASSATTAPAAAPATNTGKSFTYWVPLTGNVAATLKSYSEMTCYKELEKITGIKINFQHVPDNPQAIEQFNLLVASGKYPDLLEWGNWFSLPGGPAKYIKDGVIIRLNEAIDKWAPNLKKVLEGNPLYRKQARTDDGDMFMFPFVRGHPGLMSFYGPWVRKDILQTYNLKAPNTINDWTEMFKGLKGKDFNKNGQADEYPFNPWGAGSWKGGFNGNNYPVFVGSYGIVNGFFQDNGKVKYGPATPEFKEFLAQMSSWYKEGYIDPDLIAMDSAAFAAKMTGNKIASGTTFVGSGIGNFTALMRGKEPKEFELMGVPYPVLKAGDKPMFGQRDNDLPGPGVTITSACKDVEAAVKMLDFAYSPEGHMLFNFGVKGVTYDLEANGYPRMKKEIINHPSLSLAQSWAQHARSNFNGPFVQDIRYLEQYFQFNNQKEAYALWSQPTNEKLMPNVAPTIDESRGFSRVMTAINTRMDEVFAKVFTGAEPMSTWDKFQDELKTLGVDEALKVQQAALERYNKR
jgi:putative aldouronate transport system substrate-binding protein